MAYGQMVDVYAFGILGLGLGLELGSGLGLGLGLNMCIFGGTLHTKFTASNPTQSDADPIPNRHIIICAVSLWSEL